MGLSIEEINKNLVAKQEIKNQIERAIRNQNLIKFHTQVYTQEQTSVPLTEFLSYVKKQLTTEKFHLFLSILRWPIKTNELCGVIFDKLSRVFEGRNPAFNYQFTSTQFADDWEYYRQEVLDEPNVWQTSGWEHFKTEINCIVVVDLEMEQKDKYPAPYFYFLPIERVINYKTKDAKKGTFEWIIFKTKDDKVAVFDDTSYRLFPKLEGNTLESVEIDSPHDLGYCPARFFWDMPLNLDMYQDVKYHPLLKVVSELDYYLYWHTSKKQLDNYAAYPIYSGYEQNCDFHDEKTGEHCDSGFIRNNKNEWLYGLDGRSLLPCPKCGQRRIVGPGTFVRVPVPNGSDQPDLREPVQITTVDRSSLDYNTEQEERKRNEILQSVCGTSEGVITTEAINEKQVTATFESQNTVLNRIKKGIENVWEWTDSTICRLRYGQNFIATGISLGTEFYDSTVEQLREQYSSAKENGASEAELDAMQRKILESEYRNDPVTLQRMIILNDLEPFRHFTRDEVRQLKGDGDIEETDYTIKINFSDFIRRFERENMNIIEFGNEIPYYEKIDIINKTLKRYAEQKRSGSQAGTVDS